MDFTDRWVFRAIHFLAVSAAADLFRTNHRLIAPET
jgi:hypothetical protein